VPARSVQAHLVYCVGCDHRVSPFGPWLRHALKGTRCGLPGALAVMTSVALRGPPPARGATRTLMVHLPYTPTVLRVHVSAAAKAARSAPVMVMDLIVTGAGPTLTMWMV
jgi:hypothetical protein